MGFFFKSEEERKREKILNSSWYKKAVANASKTCKLCKYYDDFRGVCVNGSNSGRTYIGAQSPSCSYFSLR